MNDLKGLTIIVWKRGWALVNNKLGLLVEDTLDEEIVKNWFNRGAQPEWLDSEDGSW